MRKKVMLLVISALIVGVLAFSLNTGLFAAGEIIQGHRLYDKKGVVNGGQSPGTDCEYTVVMKPPVN